MFQTIKSRLLLLLLLGVGFLITGYFYLSTSFIPELAGPVKKPEMPLPLDSMPLAVKSPGSDGSAPSAAGDNFASPAPQPVSAAATAARGKNRIITIDNKQYPLRTYKPLLTPNDPSAMQWWVSNTKMSSAWDVPAGSRQTTLAIIDTGFGLQHTEFQNRWYINPGESGSAVSEAISTLNCTDRSLALNAGCNLIDDDFDGTVDNESGVASYENPSRLNCSAQQRPLTKDCNRLDDDNNGYVDDYWGWDFINNDNSVQAGELNPGGGGTAHGTMVAGVAAATGNNGTGIAGVDWNTKILPIQALDDDAYGDTLSVGRAINYAVRQGADVINLSLGSSSPDSYVEQAVKAAVAAGVIVVAAAGNDACDCMVYPANYPEVVAAGALDSNNQLASFSSWGKNVDILAPGTNITTSTWSSANPTSALATGANGTSFSAPIISGLFSRLRSLQPNSKPLQLIAALTENTNRLTIPATTAQDSRLGYGSLDASKATQRVITPYNPVILYSFTPVSKGERLNPQQPADKPGSYAVHQCAEATFAGTPVYELLKGNDRFFTISDSENKNAVEAGFTSSIFTYGCLQQPLDRPLTVRNINIFREFRALYQKLE